MKKIIFASLSMLVFITCKKDENATTGSLELTSANLEGKYKTTAAVITPTGSSVGFDFYNIDAYYPACKRDDIHTFTATGQTYNYADSGVYCSTPPVGHTGVYTLVQPTQLTFDGRNYLVESLTKTSMVIVYDSTGVGKVKLTLTKQ